MYVIQNYFLKNRRLPEQTATASNKPSSSARSVRYGRHAGHMAVGARYLLWTRTKARRIHDDYSLLLQCRCWCACVGFGINVNVNGWHGLTLLRIVVGRSRTGHHHWSLLGLLGVVVHLWRWTGHHLRRLTRRIIGHLLGLLLLHRWLLLIVVVFNNWRRGSLLLLLRLSVIRRRRRLLIRFVFFWHSLLLWAQAKCFWEM